MSLAAAAAASPAGVCGARSPPPHEEIRPQLQLEPEGVLKDAGTALSFTCTCTGRAQLLRLLRLLRPECTVQYALPPTAAAVVRMAVISSPHLRRRGRQPPRQPPPRRPPPPRLPPPPLLLHLLPQARALFIARVCYCMLVVSTSLSRHAARIQLVSIVPSLTVCDCVLHTQVPPPPRPRLLLL